MAASWVAQSLYLFLLIYHNDQSRFLPSGMNVHVCSTCAWNGISHLWLSFIRCLEWDEVGFNLLEKKRASSFLSQMKAITERNFFFFLEGSGAPHWLWRKKQNQHNGKVVCGRHEGLGPHIQCPESKVIPTV